MGKRTIRCESHSDFYPFTNPYHDLLTKSCFVILSPELSHSHLWHPSSPILHSLCQNKTISCNINLEFFLLPWLHATLLLGYMTTYLLNTYPLQKSSISLPPKMIPHSLNIYKISNNK